MKFKISKELKELNTEVIYIVDVPDDSEELLYYWERMQFLKGETLIGHKYHDEIKWMYNLTQNFLVSKELKNLEN